MLRKLATYQSWSRPYPTVTEWCKTSKLEKKKKKQLIRRKREVTMASRMTGT